MSSDVTLNDRLRALGQMSDAEFSVTDALLAFSAFDHQGRNLNPYRKIVPIIGRCAAEWRDEMMSQHQAQDDLGLWVAALKHGFHHGARLEIVPDRHDKNDPLFLDIIDAVDADKCEGALASLILFDACRFLNLPCEIAALGPVFLLKIFHGQEQAIISPAKGFSRLQAHDLRKLLKQELGPDAELSISMTAPLSARAAVAKVMNIAKQRHIAGEDFPAALKLVERLQIFTPRDHELHFDAGLLYMRLFHYDAAIFALARYAENASDPRKKAECLAFLSELEQRSE